MNLHDLEDLQNLEDQYQEDMQQAELEGQQAIDDAENQLIQDLLDKIEAAAGQLIEVKYHLKRRCYISSDIKMDCALEPLNEVKKIIQSNRQNQ